MDEQDSRAKPAIVPDDSEALGLQSTLGRYPENRHAFCLKKAISYQK